MIRDTLKRLRRSETGSSLIEFAMVAPVLSLLLIGTVEIGRFTYFSILAANAARAGAQYGAQNVTTVGDTAGIASAATQDGQSLSNWSGGVTSTPLCSISGAAPTTCPSGNGGSGPPANTIYYVQVEVSGTFTPLLRYPLIPSSLPVHGNATMRVASQ
jgi:Flp pilus assembly protein TadG